jgi:cytochrome P450
MSLLDVHYDPSIFPDPNTFNPDRWLDSDDSNSNARYFPRQLKDRFFVPFGKGSRNCAGSNLAMAELYAVTGNVFRRFGCGDCGGDGETAEMRLWETGKEDVEIASEHFTPCARFDSKGLRVLIE